MERLSIRLSEAPGYFDTDNLISNEDSYQHVIPVLIASSRPGRAYIGVGPDQNYTYIASLKPSVAFILDLRRENLLQHLFYKELFRRAETRLEYLSLLFGKPLKDRFSSESMEIDDLADTLRRTPSSKSFFLGSFQGIWEEMRLRFPRLVSGQDRETVEQMAWAFWRWNLDLRFTSHGRPPRSSYPTFGELLVATDVEGVPRGYLASEAVYQFVRKMHLENRIIPVVGDLAGPSSLSGIGEYLRERGLILSAFYLSNVEFYLLRSGRFQAFVENTRSVPADAESFLIRSYFGNWGLPHPERVPGYAVTSILQTVPGFLRRNDSVPYRSYEDLVFRAYVPIGSSRGGPSVRPQGLNHSAPSSANGGGLVQRK
jgi:hypothetical protein